jgi:hypothetical protein
MDRVFIVSQRGRSDTEIWQNRLCLPSEPEMIPIPMRKINLIDLIATQRLQMKREIFAAHIPMLTYLITGCGDELPLADVPDHQPRAYIAIL